MNRMQSTSSAEALWTAMADEDSEEEERVGDMRSPYKRGAPTRADVTAFGSQVDLLGNPRASEYASSPSRRRRRQPQPTGQPAPNEAQFLQSIRHDHLQDGTLPGSPRSRRQLGRGVKDFETTIGASTVSSRAKLGPGGTSPQQRQPLSAAASANGVSPALLRAYMQAEQQSALQALRQPYGQESSADSEFMDRMMDGTGSPQRPRYDVRHVDRGRGRLQPTYSPPGKGKGTGSPQLREGVPAVSPPKPARGRA